MTETEEQKKKRLETSNAIDVRNMVNERRTVHGQVVTELNDDGKKEAFIEEKMIHTLNRRDRRKAIHQDKIKYRQELKARKKK